MFKKHFWLWVQTMCNAVVILSLLLQLIFTTNVHADTNSVQNAQDIKTSGSKTPTSTSVISSNTCSLYPIALSQNSLLNRNPGDKIEDILNGTQPGNFGWLTWTGGQSTNDLVTSLTPPGNSQTYVNPNNSSDHQITNGDLVMGKVGNSNSQSIRNALNNLKGRQIIVPVWNYTSGQGDNTYYQIVSFVKVEILDYELQGTDEISVRFLDYACQSQSTLTPTKTSTSIPTKTSSPTVTPTKTPAPSKTVAPSKTPTPSKTVAPSKTPTPSKTVVPSKTPTPSKTPSSTKKPTASETPCLSKTPTLTKTPSTTGVPTNSYTPSQLPSTPTVSITPSVTATETPSLFETSTNTETPFYTETSTEEFSSSTPTFTETAAEISTPTETLIEATLTETLVSSETPVPTSTFTETLTAIPSPSETLKPTHTFTETATETPSSTNTFTITPSYTNTFTITPSVTYTPTFTATSTPTFTLTPTLPGGVQCFNLRDNNLQGWNPSPWMDSEVEILSDGNGMYAYMNNGIHVAGVYFAMPSGSYKLLFSGQDLGNIVVAQGETAPTSAGQLSETIQQRSDGSYLINKPYVEVHWTVNSSDNQENSPVFEAFCLAPFTPTPTPTHTNTPTSSPIPNNAPEIVSTPLMNYYLPISSGSVIVLDAVIRDFKAFHPSDFEPALNMGINVVPGLVANTLGTDGKPVYIGANGQGYIESANTFNQWYNDIPDVNQKTTVPLILAETFPGSGIYAYSSNAFFPIDNMLFGNEGFGNNFHFTLETHSTFTYQGGEVFTFTGDDDLWVFINDQLVIDLGSAHPPASASVNLDTLNLTIGDTYTFDLFFAERHTYGSNFLIQTSIELEPGQQYTYDVDATDLDSDNLVYSLVTAPAEMTIDTETGSINWNPNSNDLGDHEVIVQVSDGHGGIDSQTFVLHVLPPGTPTPLPSDTPTSTPTTTPDATQTLPPEIIIIPKEENNYKYNIFPIGNVPSDFWSFTFDDTLFPIGNAPFGSGSGCPIQTTVNTFWNTNSDIVLRKSFDLPLGASNLKITTSIDNDIQVYVNEVEITNGLITHDGCANVNEFVFPIPDSALLVGENLLAVLARDRGIEGFVDVQITGNLPVTTPTFVISTPSLTPTTIPSPTPTPPDYSEVSVPGWIASPVNESSISGIVPIILADNVTLQSGTIMYWPADDRTAVTTLANNLSGTGGSTLASLDTTTLANGSYVVMLSGTDSNNNFQNSAVLITVIGEYKPGRVRFTINDMTVPVSGLPIVIGRTYDSLNRNVPSDFGYGWDLAIANPKLEVDQAHNVTLTMPDGKRTTFYFTPESFGGWFGFMLAPKYTPEAGVYGSLTVPSECGAVVVSGGSYFCFPGNLYDPQEYTYTDPYGREFVMSKDGTLKTITDLNGNVLTFTPNGITSSMDGVHVDFVRDSLGRITEITGPDNTDYLYEYDIDGNLEVVTLPNNGQQAELRYGYYAGHYFKEAFDPRGNRPVITTYDSAGRMESVTDAMGSKTVYTYDLGTRTTTISYLGDPNNPADDLGDSTQVHDEAGYLVSSTNPLNQTTVYEYNSAHKLIKVTDDLNHSVQYTYDDKGNPTSIIDPLMNTVGSITYNKYGGPVTITVPGVSNTTIAYDPVTFMPLSAGDNMGPLGGYTWDEHGNPETFTDQNGETTGYTYTAQGYVETATDPLGHVTRYQYDLFGRVTDVTQAYGTSESVTTHYVYDELGRQEEVTSAYGTAEAATTRYEYDANGNMTAVIDPLLRRTEYEYDSANRLTAVIYAAHAPAESTTTEYVYDIYGRLTDTTIAAGTADASTTHYIYDALGHKTDVITAYGTSHASTTHYQYDAAGRTTFVTAAYGTSSAATVHYQYDAVGRMTDMTIAHGTANASTTHYTYYNTGRMESMTTAYGTPFAATTHYEYDARGRASQTTYADGTTTTQDYDPLPNTPGWVQSTTDQAGITTEYVYDAAGRLEELITHATDGQTQTQRYEYDAANRLVNSFDALNNRTSFTYYLNGQTHTTSSWLDASTSYTTTYFYNPAGEQIAVLDAKNHTTSYDYNERGMLEKTTYEGGVFTSQTYDAANRLVTSTDENGITTRSVYNAASQLSSVTLADGTSDEATVQYEYNAAGQLTRMIDAMNHATQFEYNAAGQQVKKILPDLSFEEYGYNAAGNQVSHRLTDGNTNTFTYDLMNRLTEISYFDGQYANFTYTNAGQRDTASTRVSSPAIPQVYDYSYDTFGRLDGVEYPDGRDITYTYNANNQILTMTTPGGTTSYGYDALSRLTSVNGTTFEYDALGLLTDEHLSNGVTTSYGYDDLNRLTNITQQLGSTLIGSYVYTLDDAGNRLSVNEMGGQSIHWTYDDLYRLKSETRKNGATIVAQSSFTYDLTGNRLSQTVDGVMTSYTYNELDQMLTAGSVQYEYDDRGNLKKEIDGSQIAQYNYDAANRLANVITPDGTTITNSYDADGRRVKQTVNAQVTTYLWDATSLYGDVVLETTGGVSTSYTLAGTQLISQTRNGSTSYYLQDGQGSTRALTNSAGAVTDTYSYTAFGEIYNQTGTTANSYLYTGQQFDPSTGLYSLRARFYNPSWGRFLSQDTWAVNYSNPIELNRYGYAAGNPIKYIDPSGYTLAESGINWGAVFRNAVVVTTVLVGAYIIFQVVGEVLEESETASQAFERIAQQHYNNSNNPTPGATVFPPPIPGWTPQPYNTPIATQESPTEEPEERVLVVGEDDFGYTMALASIHPDWDITGARYGNGSNTQYISGTFNNVTFVEDVDARRLESGAVTGNNYYDGIIFNNPHVAIEDEAANASLIRLFIQSARTRLSFSGEIHINITKEFLTTYPMAAAELGLYDLSSASLNNLNNFGSSKYFAPYVPHYTDGRRFPPFDVRKLKNFVFYN
ncbi:MAG: hypothetical protein KPEEDBHJ_00197 [Anaerolineales bacterium]|nr:hypothetical protein [Anaerolineales bacterium]